MTPRPYVRMMSGPDATRLGQRPSFAGRRLGPTFSLTTLLEPMARALGNLSSGYSFTHLERWGQTGYRRRELRDLGRLAGRAAASRLPLPG